MFNHFKEFCCKGRKRNRLVAGGGIDGKKRDVSTLMGMVQ